MLRVVACVCVVEPGRMFLQQLVVAAQCSPCSGSGWRGGGLGLRHPVVSGCCQAPCCSRVTPCTALYCTALPDLCLLLSCVPFTHPHPQTDWGWGIVVSVLRRSLKQSNNNAGNASAAAAAAAAVEDDIDAVNKAELYVVDTLLPCQHGSLQQGSTRPAPIGINGSNGNSTDGGGNDKAGGSSKAAVGSSRKAAGTNGNGGGGGGGAGAAGSNDAPDAELHVVPVLLPLVHQISSLRVSLPADLRSPEVRKSLLLVLEVRSGAGGGRAGTLARSCMFCWGHQPYPVGKN